jgi:5-methylcytosine-specific restriction enzyme subunit McrC
LSAPSPRPIASGEHGIEISIEPKVPIGRLLFLVGYASHGVTWLPDTVPVDQEAEDLISVVAQALWRQTERAVHQGLLPGYILVEDSSPFLRGRLRESEQLHRHHGLPLPLEIQHDEFTTDIPENRIRRTACERMLTVPRLDAESQRMLRRLLRDFADVTPLTRGDPIPAWQRPGSMPAITWRCGSPNWCSAPPQSSTGRHCCRQRLPPGHAGALRGFRYRSPP